MQDWQPDALAAIARRLGLPSDDLSPPRRLGLRGPNGRDGLSVLDWGGTGPAAVLLHGGSLTGRTWDYVALALRRDYRIIAPDMRGHGASDWTDDYCFEGYVADTLAVLDGLDLERVHIAGMSLGGLVACEVALAHPGRVETLAMIDVASKVDVEASATMRRFINEFSGAETVDEVVRTAMAISPRSDPERVRYRMASLLRQGPDGRLAWKRDPRPRDIGWILRQLQTLDRRVSAFAAPFLLARGGRSRILSSEDAQAFVARFQDGRSVEIADAGHNVQEDNPRDLAEALSQFWTGRRP
jgi:pimeloyl-ACP methyl ester carboxylesterase